MPHLPIPVFFSPSMVAANHDSFSPSAGKPAAVVESWKRLGVPLVIRPPVAASVDELATAHCRRYVEDVLACTRPNGFGNRSPEVAAALPYTTGAMLSAARHVVDGNSPVAVAPCSGFHHAHWDRGGGYCTFNGLMVTAMTLLAEGRARRVGIIDLDNHIGDGTLALCARFGANNWLEHHTGGETHGVPGRRPAKFFRALPRILDRMLGCDVVLYQAGADAHIDDPLGGWMTTAELHERDLRVIGGLIAMRVPVVWNLAGGYQRDNSGGISKVLEIHDNTMRATATMLAVQDVA